MSGGETAIYSDSESSTGETNSMYQLQDGRLEGCSDGNSIPNPYEPPSRVAIFMASTQRVLNSTSVAALTSSSTVAATAGASGSARPPAQVLSELLDALATLMGIEVTPQTHAQHKVDTAKLRDEITQAREELNAEYARMATE